MTLLDPNFWRSIGLALVRTAIAGIVPFLPGLTSDPAATWPLALGTVGLLLIVTVATSLKGLADASTATWWEILVARGLRQFGQFFAAGLVGAAVLSDVDWPTLLQGASASALSTVLLAALTIIPGADYTVAYLPREAIVTGPFPEVVDYSIGDGAEPEVYARRVEDDTPPADEDNWARPGD